MRGYLQTDYRFPREFNLSGCNVRSLMAAAEDHTGKQLTVEQILEILRTVITNDWVRPTMFVLLPGKVVEETARVLGKNISCWDIGSVTAGTPHYWGGYDHDTKVSFFIRKGLTKKGNTHFRYARSLSEITFDPYPVETVVEEITAYMFTIKDLA